MKSTVAFVLGGGRGSRLYPLTKYRSKPAVPLAGKYRLIDIPLSNCINSSLNRIYVLTQFMSVSLHRHIRQTYRFDRFGNGFVELLAAQQTAEVGKDWYQGTADAVRKNIRYLHQPGIEYVLILSGDQLYRMDYQEMLASHQKTQADVSIAALPVSHDDAKSLGVMRIDDTGRVTDFVEKPQTDEAVREVIMDPAWLADHGIESHGRDCLASMGIYLFNRDVLVDLLESDCEDFGREVFPASIKRHRVQVHPFDDYWEDIGTIRAFYEANLALARRSPPFRLTEQDAPIYSRARFLPPSQIDGANIRGSLIADGCKIGAGVTIEDSVIGLRCVIGQGVTIRKSVLMGADYYDTDREFDESRKVGLPPLGIGEGSTISGAIVDKNCRIGSNVNIHDRSEEDREISDDCVIRDGVVCVLKNGVLPNGFQA